MSLNDDKKVHVWVCLNCGKHQSSPKEPMSAGLSKCKGSAIGLHSWKLER